MKRGFDQTSAVCPTTARVKESASFSISCVETVLLWEALLMPTRRGQCRDRQEQEVSVARGCVLQNQHLCDITLRTNTLEPGVSSCALGVVVCTNNWFCVLRLDLCTKFKFKSFIVRCTDQHRVRLGTEILRTRQLVLFTKI